MNEKNSYTHKPKGTREIQTDKKKNEETERERERTISLFIVVFVGKKKVHHSKFNSSMNRNGMKFYKMQCGIHMYMLYYFDRKPIWTNENDERQFWYWTYLVYTKKLNQTIQTNQPYNQIKMIEIDVAQQSSMCVITHHMCGYPQFLKRKF